MSISFINFKNHVVVPVLKNMCMYSDASVNLILGTAAVEYDFGAHLKQIKGPAVSPYGIEEATYNDIVHRYLDTREPLKQAVLSNCGYGREFPAFKNIRNDYWAATIVARLKYYMMPESLPNSYDIEALAKYWKKYYNTEGGKGTVEKFIEKYEKYVAGR